MMQVQLEPVWRAVTASGTLSECKARARVRVLVAKTKQTIPCAPRLPPATAIPTIATGSYTGMFAASGPTPSPSLQSFTLNLNSVHWQACLRVRLTLPGQPRVLT